MVARAKRPSPALTDHLPVQSSELVQGINCSRAILESVGEIGVDLRIGLHIGECDVIGDKLRGIAVHSSRVVSKAGAGEILLVSQTVRDLVVGSGLEFQDRGSHELKGGGGSTVSWPWPRSERVWSVAPETN